jgi:hypothetical protein
MCRARAALGTSAGSLLGSSRADTPYERIYGPARTANRRHGLSLLAGTSDESRGGTVSVDITRMIIQAPMYFYAPGMAALTSTIVDGDPGDINAWGATQKTDGAQLGSLGKTLDDHTSSTKEWWQGESAWALRGAGWSVAKGFAEQSGQVGKIGTAAVNLGVDFKHLADLVLDGQKTANFTVLALSKIPIVGPALATAASAKTYVWTGLCAVQLVRVGKDAAELFSSLKTKHIQNSYTPPATTTALATPAAVTPTAQHDVTPFGGTTATATT